MSLKEGLEKTLGDFSINYISLITNLGKVGKFMNLLIILLISILFCLFIWKLSKYISKKNLFEFNLNKHNSSDHAIFTNLISGFFFIIEFLVITPILIMAWFIIFSFLLLLLPGNSLLGIFSVSLVIICSIRITAYYNEELSIAIAKFVPLPLLSYALINTQFFEVGRTILRLNDLLLFTKTIGFFLIFIFIIELIMRIFDLILSFFIKEK